MRHLVNWIPVLAGLVLISASDAHAVGVGTDPSSCRTYQMCRGAFFLVNQTGQAVTGLHGEVYQNLPGQQLSCGYSRCDAFESGSGRLGPCDRFPDLPPRNQFTFDMNVPFHVLYPSGLPSGTGTWVELSLSYVGQDPMCFDDWWWTADGQRVLNPAGGDNGLGLPPKCGLLFGWTRWTANNDTVIAPMTISNFGQEPIELREIVLLASRNDYEHLYDVPFGDGTVDPVNISLAAGESYSQDYSIAVDYSWFSHVYTRCTFADGKVVYSDSPHLGFVSVKTMTWGQVRMLYR